MVLTPFKKAVRRTAHKCLEVESTQREVLFLFRMLGSLSGISDYLIWEFMEFHWGLLLMNLYSNQRLTKTFNFTACFLGELIYLLIYFTQGSGNLENAYFHTQGMSFLNIDKNKSH